MEHSSLVLVKLLQENDTEISFSSDLRILYGLCGTVTAECGGGSDSLGAGGLLVINPYEHCRIDCQSGSGMLLRITQEMLQLVDIRLKTKLKCYVADSAAGKNGEYDRVRMYFAQACKLHFQDSLQSGPKMIGCTLQLLGVLTDCFQTTKKVDISSKEWESVNQRCARIIQYIHENWKDAITVEQMAQREYLSVGYFSKYFKRYIGTPFSEYLTGIRIQRAARDLAAQKGTVTQIAMDNGFTNVNSFIEQFKARFGETPKRYQSLNGKPTYKIDIEQAVQSVQTGISELLRYAELEIPSGAALPLPTEYRIDTFDAHGAGMPLRHTWRRLLNIGYARDGLLAEVQNQLRAAQQEIGFEYLRFHGILDDDMHIYHEDEKGRPYLDFSRVDLLLDFVLSLGMKPYIELSYMPKLLALHDRALFDRVVYLSAYNNESKWRYLIKGLVRHCVERYGRDQVLVWRFTTIGCHMQSLGFMGFDEYLELYRAAYESVKSVDTRIQFGGPGGMVQLTWESRYIQDFFAYASNRNCVPDFVCTQCYPYRTIEQDVDFLNYTVSQSASPAILSEDEHYTQTILNDYRKLLEASGVGHLPIWIEEWNSTLWQRDLSSDTCYKSAWLAKNLCENLDGAEAFGYWLLTDFMEERSDFGKVFHGGYGLFTYNSIPKSGWLALRLVNMLGNRLLSAGEGWLATKSENGIQILLSNYCHYSRLYCYRYQRLENPGQAYDVFVDRGAAEYTLRITGIRPGRYEIQRRSISRMQGSSFDAWLKMGAPQYLRASEIAYLQKVSQPQYHIESMELEETYLLECKLEPHEVQIIQLKAEDSQLQDRERN